MFFKELKTYTTEFKKHWLGYLTLFLSLDLLNQFIVIPFFRYITTFILQASAIPFVSYQNVVTIITTHTFIFVILIVELLFLLVVIYAQFAYLLHGIHAIYDESFTFKRSFIQTWQNIRKIRLGSMLLLSVYFLLIVPFADIIFRTPLLAKIQIPEFILDYMTRTPILIMILLAFYIIVLFLGVRLLFTLPIMIFEHKKTKTAMKKSWCLTKNKQWWSIVWRLLVLGIIISVAIGIFYLAIYVLQLLWDLLPGKYPALILAIANLSFIQIISELAIVYATVLSFFIIFKPLELKPASVRIRKPVKHKILVIFTSLIFGAVAITAITTNILYLVHVNDSAPLVISHRGVDDENGVQNTIQSLKKTAKEKTDYVEIDLHETKDKQFIVLHDDNLNTLTGLNEIPSQLTLKQLTRLTAKDNGYKTKLTSFDQYIEEAKKLHQKLLIEIKTTPHDSKKMLNRFNKKYGETVLKNKYQLQSLDYRVIEKLHQINPKLTVFYIQPYNFTYPHSLAAGYSMEYSTLNTDFIWQAHLQNHPVYAWTINDETLMKKMMYDQVDGIITDKVRLAKKTIKEFQQNSSYANKILNYITVVRVPNELEA